MGSNIDTVVRELPADLAALKKKPKIAHAFPRHVQVAPGARALCGYVVPEGKTAKLWGGVTERCVVCLGLLEKKGF